MQAARWISAGLLLLASACTPVSEAAPLSSEAARPEDVIAYGFDAIKDRYLTDVSIGDLAQESLKGLSGLDPSLSIDRSSNRRIVLRYRDERIAEHPLPAADDAQGWASLIVTFAHAAAKESPELRKADAERLYETVFDAALAKLDIFSHYAGNHEADNRRAQRNGFGGVGVRYRPLPADIAVTEVIPETPAEKAGLKVGDHIAQIDGKAVGGLSHDDIGKLLRGPIDSPVTLKVKRQDTQKAALVVVHRALILPPTVTTTVTDDIATIQISGFNQGTAHLLAESLQRARKPQKGGKALKGVILDLRGNPGGLLDQGVESAALFMAPGRIVSTQGRHPASVQIFDVASRGPAQDLPLTVLVDGQSASAAEIVASALQDSGRAVVVGTNSFGKGTVQTVVHLPNDGEMTLTWSRYYSPSGYALHGLGVFPSVCTAQSDKPASLLLKTALEDREETQKVLTQWRQTAVDDQEERRRLRGLCPAAEHDDATPDEDLARQILKDGRLYRRLLAPAGNRSVGN